ncbi:hypothetical protein [Streptomyces sp. S186]|uniref:hypothetical protein n=1 Tax=Streptomyces sp. S186 TaxID=3434395 RepID=UPI003F675DE4
MQPANYRTPTTTRPPNKALLGDRVSHDRYGLGKIIGVECETAMLVDFGSHEVRIVSPYTGLHKP